MNIEEAKRMVLEAVVSGRIAPTNIIFGDNVQHKIEHVDAGGIGIQIVHGHGPSEEKPSPYPKEGDYAGVIKWLERQKQKEHIDYYQACGQNRSELCRKLTKIFGWEVSSNSLQKHENRKK